MNFLMGHADDGWFCSEVKEEIADKTWMREPIVAYTRAFRSWER